MLEHIRTFSFLVITSIPIYKYMTAYLSILLLMDLSILNKTAMNFCKRHFLVEYFICLGQIPIMMVNFMCHHGEYFRMNLTFKWSTLDKQIAFQNVGGPHLISWRAKQNKRLTSPSYTKFSNRWPLDFTCTISSSGFAACWPALLD